MRVYVALGGNIGDTKSVFEKAIQKLRALGKNLQTSPFYITKPVSHIPQEDYLNAVVVFDTALAPIPLMNALERVEKELGKTPKPKEAPRIIDLDLLFYGTESFKEDNLIIPHPRWKDRFFVLKPLSDLVEEIEVDGEIYKIKEMLHENDRN